MKTIFSRLVLPVALAAAFAAGATDMRELTSLQLSQQMSPGLNLGNTLEALPSETAWGNPPTHQAVMDAFKAAGFKTVRIPVAWNQYADADGNISPAWMARVTQVVDYARKAGLVVIINTHWDGGWADHPTYAKQAEVNAKLAKFWTQIARHFQGHDEHLLFAGTNEVHIKGEYGKATAENCAVQNSFNQTFVNAVRATGGNNAKRHLVVQSYNTNHEEALTCNAKLPADTVADRLMVEVHYYDPFPFTLDHDSKFWQWGKNATDPAATAGWGNEDHVDAAFRKLKAAFVDKGVPVLLGEYGAGMKRKYPGMDRYRKDWNEYVTGSAVRHGMVPVYWDTGGLFDRVTGARKDAAIDLIVNAANKP
ncbi:glycoside hydrolase family 5 protein [Roseateles sp. LYH14W]|uniref:Glycoside hydrolase family 5 protein n=1 Tax=Pelomonas parva TaxID=3299032 RepID=A0ABW7F8J4_9BURK